MNSDKTKKLIKIIVNGSPFDVEKDDITYDEVVTLVYPDYPQHQEINYSVTYKRGHGNKPEGILIKGQSVKVKDEMRFDVTPTGQS